MAYEPEYSISYKTAWAPSKDSDQPAHSRSLIRVFTWYSVGNQGSNTNILIGDDSHQPVPMRIDDVLSLSMLGRISADDFFF